MRALLSRCRAAPTPATCMFRAPRVRIYSTPNMPSYNARQQQARRPRAGNCGGTYGNTSAPWSTPAAAFMRHFTYCTCWPREYFMCSALLLLATSQRSLTCLVNFERILQYEQPLYVLTCSAGSSCADTLRRLMMPQVPSHGMLARTDLATCKAWSSSYGCGASAPAHSAGRT